MDISIRSASSDDWKTIQHLNHEVFLADEMNDDDLDLQWPFSAEGIQYYHDLANGTYGHCFIAEIEKKPIGYVALAKKKFGYRKSRYVEIENIGVTPEYRAHGIGTQLINAAVTWAKEQGAERLYVSAYWGNIKGRAFYKKCGFEEIGVEFDKKI